MSKHYSIIQVLRWFLLSMALLCFVQSLAQEAAFASTQGRRNDIPAEEKRPLREVLRDLQSHYNISFVYEFQIVDGKEVPSEVRFRSQVENTLNEILQPVGLQFRKINRRTYSIFSKEADRRKSEAASIMRRGNVSFDQSGQRIAMRASSMMSTASEEDVADFVVRGKVADEQSNPIPGVNILLKGTTIGTTSDVSGDYSISVPDEGAVLVFSFIGYLTEEIAVGNRMEVNVTLMPDVKQLGEVVVVGYGTQKRASVTGAISSVSSEEIGLQPVVNIGQALQGRVPGVTVVNNGAPGAAPIVRIRGVGTVNDANPLYVIDGFPTGDLNSINTKDIESIEVLKDASAAAIYGSRAANGVILITTKRGSNKRLSVNLDSYYGVEQAWRKLDLLNTEQYIDYASELLLNSEDGVVPPRIATGLDQPLNSTTSQTFRQTETDWQNEMFRTAPIQQHKIELAGGNEVSKMFGSMGYFDQDGIMLGTGYRRGDARFNSDHQISRRITFGQNFYVAYDERKVEQNAGGRTQLQHIIRSSPYFPVYNPDNYGGFFGAQGVDASDPENPVRVALRDQQNQQRLKLLANAYVDVKLLDFLTYRFQGGVDYVAYTQRTHLPAYSSGPGGYSNRAAANVNQNRQGFISVILTNQLSFNKTFERHTINATVIAEQQTFTFSQITGQGNNTQSNEIFEPVALANVSFSGDRSESALISYVGRVNYEFANKYLVGASFRRDGSSRFDKGNKWGSFPAVSLGWRLSEEGFLSNSNLFSDLKLRASYGLTGNNNTRNNDYPFISTISGNQIYQFDIGSSVGSTGYTIRALANSNIKWETTYMSNIGVDVGLLNDKLTFTAEFFNNRTTDMILPLPVPISYGYDGVPIANLGEVENKGFELQLGYNKSQGDLMFTASGNISVVRNEVLDLGDEGTTISSGDWYGDNLTNTKVGEPIGYFNGYVTDGIFQQGESSPLQPDALPGDIRFKDTNGDGALNADDKRNLGHFLPDFSYGINLTADWKGFDASLFMQGVSGNEIYTIVKYELEGMTRLFNSGTAVLNRWTPENTVTNVPRAVSGDPSGNARASSRFVEDGSYFRIKNLTLGYNFPSNALASLTNNSLTRLRIYVTTQNLLTLTKYKSGYDPEIGNRNNENMTAPLTQSLVQGIDYGQYPQARSVVVGLQLGF